MNPTRVSPGGSFRFDRRFAGVGRITRASGAQELRTFRRLDDLLTELYEDAKLDILRAIKDGRLTALEVYDARRRGELTHVAGDLVLFRGLWQAVDEWLPASGPSASTRDRLRVSWVVLRREKVLPEKALVRDLERVRWAKVMERWPNSGADWNRMRAAVSRFLSALLGDTYHPFRRRVMGLIPKAWESDGRVPDLNVALFWALVREISPDARAAVVTLAATGLRRGEYLALRDEHLLPHTRQIVVPGTKTGSSRAAIVVGEQAWEWVRAAVPATLTKKQLYTRFKDAARAVGAPSLTLHDLRHLKGMVLSDAGLPDAIIQDALRHATPGMTRRYTRQREQGRAGEATDRALFGGEETA